MHRRAERGEDAHPPIADLVAEPLDHDRAVVGDDSGGLRLLVEVVDDVAGGEAIEAIVAHQSLDGNLVAHRPHLALERAECPAELEWPARAITVPEGHLALLARCGSDRDPLERDLLDPPRAGAEHEGLTWPALVDHLLVKLADTRAVGQEHAVQPAIGDGATAGDRQPLRTLTRSQGSAGAIPHQPWAQLVELVAGIAARQQVEHVVQQVVAELGEVGATPNERGDGLHRALRIGGDVGNDLLCQHVERVAQEASGLDLPADHALRDHCCFQQVAAMLGVHDAPAGLAHRVAGAPHTLHAPRDGAR